MVCIIVVRQFSPLAIIFRSHKRNSFDRTETLFK